MKGYYWSKSRNVVKEYRTRWRLGLAITYCLRSELSSNPNKISIALFIKRRKLDGLCLPNMSGITLELSKEVKYLQVFLDKKLLYNQLEMHLNRLLNLYFEQNYLNQSKWRSWLCDDKQRNKHKCLFSCQHHAHRRSFQFAWWQWIAFNETGGLACKIWKCPNKITDITFCYNKRKCDLISPTSHIILDSRCYQTLSITSVIFALLLPHS